MFAGLINQAKSTVSHLVLKYVARLSVAVPFVIAAGFALAAITVTLVERFGHVMAYWLVAGGLALSASSRPSLSRSRSMRKRLSNSRRRRLIPKRWSAMPLPKRLPKPRSPCSALL